MTTPDQRTISNPMKVGTNNDLELQLNWNVLVLIRDDQKKSIVEITADYDWEWLPQA